MLSPKRLWMLALALPLCGVAVAASDEYIAGTLTEAATEVSFLSFDRGLPLFEKALSLAKPGSDEWLAAAFGRATCLAHFTPATPEKILEAAAGFREIADKHPQSRFAAPSLMALGRIDELVDYLGDSPKREAARGWYEKAQEKAGETALAHEATLRIAGTYIQEMTTDSVRKGIEVLENWLAKHPKNPLASAMWQYAADSYLYPLKEERKALEAYKKAEDLGFLERGREGPLYWRMANLAEKINDRDTAVTYYTKIIQKTPTSGKAFESQLALKRLGAPVPEITLFATTAPATRPTDASAQRTEKP